MKTFFVSYATADEAWASWVAWVLEEAGFSVVLQAWDFRPGSNFMLDIQRALQQAERIIVILSPAYVESDYASAEWAAGVATDPTGIARKVVPVRVERCEPPGLLRAITYIDLVDQHDEELARKKLLDGLTRLRMKPEKPPPYPGATRPRIAPNHPAFPAGAVLSKAQPAPYIPRLTAEVTELDLRRFVQASFEQIRRYFEHGLRELKASDPRFDAEFQLVHAMKFIAEVYVEGKQRCSAKLWLNSSLGRDLAIGYAEGPGLQVEQDTQFNEILVASADEEGLYLKASMSTGASLGQDSSLLHPERMSAEQAAAYLWHRFIQKLIPPSRGATPQRSAARVRSTNDSPSMVADAPWSEPSPPPRSPQTQAIKLELWREYMRAEIPPLFGLEFSEAIWNTGFVPTAQHVFLLVTLEKGAMVGEHQYKDHFLSPDRFQWESQNRTTQGGKHGRLLRNHAKEGVQVHLFVRVSKQRRSTGGAAPFVYCGPVFFESWKGEKPITVVWKLSEPVPKDLRETLKVPA
jgi:hypothetical protein